LAEIAHGLSSNLLTRAADVTLKERRRLVLLTRETPLNAAHLKNMLSITEMGGIIAPPVPAFYHHPQSVLDIVDQTVGRMLDLFGFDCARVRRWEPKQIKYRNPGQAKIVETPGEVGSTK
jgi:flavin prenyltransferase